MVRIRPIRPSDADALADGFARLSTQSRQLRFLTPKRRLSAKELRYLTDVDHHDHEALVALHRFGGRGLGVARFVRHRDDPHVAEVAVTVVDEWQGRGLGTDLARRLTQRARHEGIRRFSASMSAENRRARRLLGSVGGTVTLLGRDSGTVSYEVTLPPAEGVRRSRSAWPVQPGGRPLRPSECR
jgi:RimJ/RimL family protein N-acetyltransferase